VAPSEDYGILCVATGRIDSGDVFEDRDVQRYKTLRFKESQIITIVNRDVIVGWSEGYVISCKRKKIGILPNSYIFPLEFAV
jgi:hypothetical protein